MGCRLLYLDSYTVSNPKQGAPSSDAIGYGITASAAIRKGLHALGFEVSCPSVEAPATAQQKGVAKLSWILGNYQAALTRLAEDPPDAVFSFHIFTTFPAEIRRMVLDLGRSTPVVGYTHGSHWDPTDTFRFVAHPGMEIVDLANLHVLDRLFLVSDYMRRTLRDNIGTLNRKLAEQIDAKAVVVGLPLDVERIDAGRSGRRFPRPTIVFNHAPVPSKNPELFIRVMARLLPSYDISVLFTRNFDRSGPGGAALAELAERFPDQVVLGRDMPLETYYDALWAADLQVSTATHESLGVATLEAMYTGTCCVLPRLGSYPEICGGHPDVLYDLGDGELEERLRYFLDNPGRRQAVGADLQARAAKYHPDRVVGRLAKAVLDVVS
jgi:glycosyltransferase involved in cell wall biosynthesis